MNPVCPYCNTEVGVGPERCFCTVCGTAHHTECWEENGGCTVFGCTAAPPDEPKVTVSAAEFSSQALVPYQQTAVYPAAVPPPPPATPPPPHPNAAREVNFTFGGYNVQPPPVVYGVPMPMQIYVAPPKSRLGYILLGIFLGAFGAHNFYAGYTGRAVAQLCLTLFTFFAGSILSWIWALVEVCIVDRDSRNINMV